MRMRLRALVFILVATLAVAVGPASVQADDTTPAPANTVARATTRPGRLSRVFVAVNGGYQSSSRAFTDARSEPLSGETRTWTADYDVKGGLLFDVGGGVRVWRQVAAGVCFSRFSDSRAASITGRVPHPFFFDQPRAISGDSAELRHEEQAVHVSALWTVPAGRHLDVTVFGGPSFFRLSRDLVEDVSHVEEGYPYDTARFGSATTTRVTSSSVGFHAGVDAAWMFTRMVGVGGFARVARARASLTSPASSRTLNLDLGGLQAGAGLRLRFGGSAGPRHGVRP